MGGGGSKTETRYSYVDNSQKLREEERQREQRRLESERRQQELREQERIARNKREAAERERQSFLTRQRNEEFADQKRKREEQERLEREKQRELEQQALTKRLALYNYKFGDKINLAAFRDLDISDVKKLRIGVFGPTGSGKSCFINTCEQTVRQTDKGSVPINTAGSEQTEGTIILEDFLYEMFFRLVDTRGFFNYNVDERCEFHDILYGRVKPGDAIRRKQDDNFTPNKFGNVDSAFDNWLHGIILVVKANDIRLQKGALKDYLLPVRKILRPLGISPVTVVTHRDKLKSDRECEDALDLASAATGSARDHTFFVANYCPDHPGPDVNTELQIFSILHFALLTSERYVKISKQQRMIKMEEELHKAMACANIGAPSGSSAPQADGNETVKCFFNRLQVKYNLDPGRVSRVLDVIAQTKIKTVVDLKACWEDIKAEVKMTVGMKKIVGDALKQVDTGSDVQQEKKAEVNTASGGKRVEEVNPLRQPVAEFESFDKLRTKRIRINQQSGYFDLSEYGVHLQVPPIAVTQTVDVTCSAHSSQSIPTPVSDGETLVSNIIELGPASTVLHEPVFVTILHSASMWNHGYEVIVKEFDRDANNWKRSTRTIVELVSSMEDVEKRTDDILSPCGPYVRVELRQFTTLAVVTRIVSDTFQVDANGAVIQSSVCPDVVVEFPRGAVKRRCDGELKVQVIPKGLNKHPNACPCPIVSIAGFDGQTISKPVTIRIPHPCLTTERPGQVRLLYLGDTEWVDITEAVSLKRQGSTIVFDIAHFSIYWVWIIIAGPMSAALIHVAASSLYQEMNHAPHTVSFSAYTKTGDVKKSFVMPLVCVVQHKQNEVTSDMKEKGLVLLGESTADIDMRPGYKAHPQLVCENELLEQDQHSPVHLKLCEDSEPCIKPLMILVNHEKVQDQVVDSMMNFVSDIAPHKVVCCLPIKITVARDTAPHQKRMISSDGAYQVRSSKSKKADQSQLRSVENFLDPENYEVVKIIGSGSFAKVYHCRDKLSRKNMAAKVVFIGDNSPEVQKHVKALKKEANILRTLEHHPFIVEYYATKNYENTLAILMEYIPGGSVYQKMMTNNGPLDEQTTRRFTWQTLRGVEHLHEKGIIHRDIKCRNILLDEKGIVRISGFGSSVDMHRDQAAAVGSHSTSSEGFHGTCYWMSPESISNEVPDQKSDIWSVGCTVVEMLVGKPPLLCDNIAIAAAMYKIAKLDVHPPEQCSQLAKEFLLLCFKCKDERPTAKQLMTKSEFLKIS